MPLGNYFRTSLIIEDNSGAGNRVVQSVTWTNIDPSFTMPHDTGVILGLHPASERRFSLTGRKPRISPYFVMTSLIGWAHT